MQSLAEEKARRFYLTTFLKEYSPRAIRAKILSSSNAPHLILSIRIPYPMRGCTIIVAEPLDLNNISDDNGHCHIFQHPHLQRVILGTEEDPSFPVTRELAVSLRFSGDYLLQKWKFFIHLAEQQRRCWLTRYLALGLACLGPVIEAVQRHATAADPSLMQIKRYLAWLMCNCEHCQRGIQHAAINQILRCPYFFFVDWDPLQLPLDTFDPYDIELVMGQTEKSWNEAWWALVQADGDVVNAIMALTDL